MLQRAVTANSFRDRHRGRTSREPRVHFHRRESSPEPKVRQIVPSKERDARIEALEMKVAAMELAMDKVDKTVDKGFSEMKMLIQGSQRTRSPSPARRSGCFECGELGHFIRDCPRKSEVGRRNRSPSPATGVSTASRTPSPALNRKGLEERPVFQSQQRV
jgi:hypothetical protein